MPDNDFKQVWEIYQNTKTLRDNAKPLWDDIGKFVNIAVDPDYSLAGNANASRRGQQVDEFIDDPTASISVNQAGDYLVGVMWGNGDKVFDVVPSRYVLELVDAEAVQDYFAFATEQTLYHMNHTDCGYVSALRPYAYDQFSFGTSGIGLFPNRAFKERAEPNALIARQYGVDNVTIDVGKSNNVDYVFATYRWRVSRIVGEFAMTKGKVDESKLAGLPDKIGKMYKKGQFNEEFTLIFGMMPRADFNPTLKGKKGMKYRGVWFMDDKKGGKNKGFFAEESFSERPINMARMILLRGEVWGRSSGTMLLSSIRAVNYMVGTAIEVMEKMADPSLGVFSNAIFGDSVLDSSPSGMTVFNSTFAGQGSGSPVFPLFDVGDPSALVQFLVPYLNDKITTAFKVDALLDFKNEVEQTATESIQRFIIRGQSLSGVLSQQKNERSVPDARRAISILMDMGELGVNPRTQAKAVEVLQKANRPERVIPDAVLEVMKSGREWYELKFNNELEKLVKTETLQNLLQLLNGIIAIHAVFPDIIEAVNWYKLLKDINDNLDANNQILLTEKEFRKKIEAIAEQRSAAFAAQAAGAAAKVGKDVAQTNKQNQEAANVK